MQPRRRSTAETNGASSTVRLADLGDAALGVGIANGEHDALAEAYSRHGAAVHGLARRFCGPERGEEVVQEVFLTLWQRPEQYDAARGSMRSFLLMKAHGRAVDALRSEATRRTRESADIRGMTAPGPEADALALARIGGEAVRRLLGDLPESERHPIGLAYFGGLTYRQVAEALGVPEGTVKARMRRGFARLREGLGDHA